MKNVHTAKIEEVERGNFPYGTEYRIVLLSGIFTFSAIQRCFKQSVENFVETHFLFRLFVCGHGTPCPYIVTIKIAFVMWDDVGIVPYNFTFKIAFVMWDVEDAVPYIVTIKIAFVMWDDVGSVPYNFTFKIAFVTWDDVGIVPYRYVN